MLAPVLAGMVLAYLMQGLVVSLERLRLPGGAAVGLVFALFMGLLLVPVALAAFGTGYLLQRLLLNRAVATDDPLTPVLVTFGIAVVLRNLMVELFGADPRALDGGALATAGFEIGGLRIGWYPVLVVVAGLQSACWVSRWREEVITPAPVIGDHHIQVRLAGENLERLLAVLGLQHVRL